MSTVRTQATFKTAYLQRELAVDAVTASQLHVGDVVTATPITYADPEGNTRKALFLTPYTTNTTPATSHFVVAQSDMTLRSGEVPKTSTDPYNYYYKDTVAANVEDGTSSAGNHDFNISTDYYKFKEGVGKGVAKTVALYAVMDVNDVVYTAIEG